MGAPPLTPSATADQFVLMIPTFVGPPAYIGSIRPGSFANGPATARKWSTLGDLAGWLDEEEVTDWLADHRIALADLRILRLPPGGEPVALVAVPGQPRPPVTLAELVAPKAA